MSSSSEPIKEQEVGAFGELSARPNPNNLVVLTVPPFELMLPHLEQQAGRQLTVAEIADFRHRAPSIVVTEEVARSMAAARQQRLRK